MRPGSNITLSVEMNSGKKARYIFSGLLLLVIVLLIFDIFLGSVNIKASEVIRALFNNTGGNVETIILKFRLPKAITAITVGIALSLSGLLMQTVFRNPMAGPDVLGLSSGASLCVAFVILGFSSGITAESLNGLGNWILVAAAWAGAGAVMLIIMVHFFTGEGYYDNPDSGHYAVKRYLGNCYNIAVFQ